MRYGRVPTHTALYVGMEAAHGIANMTFCDRRKRQKWLPGFPKGTYSKTSS